MKNEQEYMTDSFHFHTHLVINGEDTVVHAGSETGGMDIAEKTTGAIEGGTILNKNGDSITLNDVNEIYTVVEWQDTSKNEKMKERIDLFNRDSKDQTFMK